MTARMRWVVYAALAVLPVIGALFGGALVGSKPPVYSAEVRLALGRADQADAGSEAQAENLARFLSSAAVLQQLPQSRVISVAASPVPESTVIRVEAKALDSASAVEAARVGAKMLQSKVGVAAGQAKAQATLAKLQKLNRLVATYQSQVNASGPTGADYVEAQTRLASATAQQQVTNSIYLDQAKSAANTNLTLLSVAAPTGDNAKTRKQIYLLAGFGIGALLAYVIARIVGGFAVRSETRRPAEDDGRRPSAPRTRAPRGPSAEPAPNRTRTVQLPGDDEDVVERAVRGRPFDPEPETGPLLPILPVLPEQSAPAREAVRAGDSRDSRAEVDDAPTRAWPSLTVRTAGRSDGHPARRGMNGLRQETPATRRTWP